MKKHKWIEHHPKRSTRGYWKCAKCGKRLLLDADGYIRRYDAINSPCIALAGRCKLCMGHKVVKFGRVVSQCWRCKGTGKEGV